MIGEAAALVAASLWALASVWYRRLGEVAGPTALNLVKSALALAMLALTLVVLVLLGHASWRIAELSPQQWTWLGVSGIVGFTIGDSAYFAALVRLGAARTLMLWTLAPAFTALLGAWWLGEALTTRMLAGIGATLAGVAWVVSDDQRSDVEREGLALGIALGVLAAACQGAGAALSKLGGLGPEGSVPLSGLTISVIRIAFGVAALIVWAGWTGELRRAPALAGPRHRGLLIVACFAGTYIGLWLSMFAVMQAATAGIAATLLATSPLFALPIAMYEGQRVGVRAYGGALLAMLGVAILCIE